MQAGLEAMGPSGKAQNRQDEKRRKFPLGTAAALWRRLQERRKRKRRRRAEHSDRSRPEWKYQLMICTLVMQEKLSTRLGQIASIGATTILLGGFISGLSSYDFWVISSLTLASSLRLFGMTQEQKINFSGDTRRRVLLTYLHGILFKGRRKFHIERSTVIAGCLDGLIYLLQLLSAAVSLVFCALRLSQQDFGGEGADYRNQKGSLKLYYTLVLIEVSLFIPAKLCWELPRPFNKRPFFSLSYDRDILTSIFNLVDNYFVEVLSLARLSVVRGLKMSLRRYISEALQAGGATLDRSAAILILNMLYRRDEWIKIKQDAEKRVKLLPVVLSYIKDSSSDEQHGREAATSLLTSLIVNKPSIPEPCKYGPHVLFKALDCSDFRYILSEDESVQEAVAAYLTSCIQSRSKVEVTLAVRAVRKLDACFVQQRGILEVLVTQAHVLLLQGADAHRGQDVNIPALIALAISELGLRPPGWDHEVAGIVRSLVERPAKLREMEILVGLNRLGLMSRQDREQVDISKQFNESSLPRCLPEVVQWLSQLEEELLLKQLQSMEAWRKRWLLRYLEDEGGGGSRSSSMSELRKLVMRCMQSGCSNP